VAQVVRQHRAAAQEQRRVHRGGPGRGAVLAKMFRHGTLMIFSTDFFKINSNYYYYQLLVDGF